jgi:peptide/nickel transport system substrate-binding protein
VLIKTLMGGHARPAQSLLPPTHWAWSAGETQYGYDPQLAEALLNEANHPRGADGVRFHLTMKTSSVEDVRLLSAVLQQQLAKIGIALDLRTYEFATFYADVTRGAFQMYSLRWIGGNEQPEIFSYAYSTSRIPPKGANRGRYSNAKLDALLKDAAENPNQDQQRADYVEAQRILSNDVPAVNLWYRDTVVVHNRRLTNISPAPSGSFRFLEMAELAK